MDSGKMERWPYVEIDGAGRLWLLEGMCPILGIGGSFWNVRMVTNTYATNIVPMQYTRNLSIAVPFTVLRYACPCLLLLLFAILLVFLSFSRVARNGAISSSFFWIVHQFLRSKNICVYFLVSLCYYVLPNIHV